MTMPTPSKIELGTGFLKGHSLPERSHLFALAPVDSPAEQTESLISLLNRTCGAHSVNPRRLVIEVLAKTTPDVGALAYSRFFNRLASTINGLGKYANLFVQVLESHTGRQGLSRLTMLPWQGLFPHKGTGMLAAHPRWCSACILEQRRNRDDIYFPLLWSIDDYRNCMVHGQPLDDHCPHCGKQQPFIPQYPDQGICHHCFRSLIHFSPGSTGTNLPTVSAFESWTGRALGTMVAHHQSAVDFSPSVGEFHCAIRSIVKVATGGNRSAFCRAIGFSENWMSKAHRPSLKQFLALSYAVQVPPIYLLSGGALLNTNQYTLLLPPGKTKDRKRSPMSDGIYRDRLLKYLMEALRSEQANSVAAIAQQCGLRARHLRYWFPEACRRISERHKQSQRHNSAKRVEADVLRVYQVVQELRNDSRYPSWVKVNTILRKEGTSLVRPILREAYRAALAV